MYSSARKYSSPARPKSNTGTMFEWTSTDCRRASSMNWLTASRLRAMCGCIRLTTNWRTNPSAPWAAAMKISAIPPSPIRSINL